MNKKDLKKLKEVVENNYKWPLILEGVTPDYFPSGVVVEGDIDSSQLESFETAMGEKIPASTPTLAEETKRRSLWTPSTSRTLLRCRISTMASP